MKLEEVLLKGDRASQPAANTVPAGSLYCVDDESFIIEQSDGATWSEYSPTGGAGAVAFTDLTDVPASYAGQASKVVSVKGDESGLEFTTPSGGSSDVLVARLDVTDAQLRTLGTVPLTIVAAPGAGIAIVPTRVIWKGVRSGTAFNTDVTHTFRWAGIATDLVSLPAFIWNSAVAATLYRLSTPAAFSGSTVQDPTNKALQLGSSGDMTLGAGCSLHLIVEYYLADFN